MLKDELENGVLSKESFQRAIKWFAQKSALLGDEWQLEEYTHDSGLPSIPYLRKISSVSLSIVSATISPEASSRQTFTTFAAMVEDDEEEDLCEWTGRKTDGAEDRSTADFKEKVCCLSEHHIIYSDSYCVPVVYFNIYKPGGDLLSLEEVWNEMKLRGVGRTRSKRDLWSLVTQQEHPLLRRPFFYLHPCHTAELLKEIRSHQNVSIDHKLLSTELSRSLRRNESDEGSSLSTRSYFVAWLSTVSPIVLLQLSYKYAIDFRNDSSE